MESDQPVGGVQKKKTFRVKHLTALTTIFRPSLLHLRLVRLNQTYPSLAHHPRLVHLNLVRHLVVRLNLVPHLRLAHPNLVHLILILMK